jgi:tRNA threonylcarbamoyladenosine biosynthesis protein TsaB
VIGVLSTATDETYSSRIFRQLEFLLKELDLSLDSFDLFAVNAGPGSFTGLRVGLTAAKAWADAFCKPVVGVSGLEAVAAEAVVGADHVVPVMDARRGQLYAGSYKRGGGTDCDFPMLHRASDDAVMSPEEFQTWLDAPERRAATLATPARNWLGKLLSDGNSAPRNIFEVSAVLAPAIGQVAYSKSRLGETVDALRLDANYVRRSDAELNWKGK